VNGVDWHTSSSRLPSSLSIRGIVPHSSFRCVDISFIGKSSRCQPKKDQRKERWDELRLRSFKKADERQSPASTKAKAGDNEVIIAD
jgi:hypothetical protein